MIRPSLYAFLGLVVLVIIPVLDKILGSYSVERLSKARLDIRRSVLVLGPEEVDNLLECGEPEGSEDFDNVGTKSSSLWTGKNNSTTGGRVWRVLYQVVTPLGPIDAQYLDGHVDFVLIWPCPAHVDQRDA